MGDSGDQGEFGSSLGKYLPSDPRWPELILLRTGGTGFPYLPLPDLFLQG